MPRSRRTKEQHEQEASLGQRTYGTGRVRELPSGRFQARFPVDGELIKAPHTFATWKEADDWCTEQRKAVEKGEWRDPRSGAMTLRDFALDEWLPRKTLAPRTAANYQRFMLKKVLTDPALDVALNELRTADIQRWFAKLSGATPSTASKAARALNGCLNMAVADGRLDENPLKLEGKWYEEPTGGDDRPYASPLDVERVAAAVPPRWRAMVYVCSYCGLRWGEMYGLRVSDINLTRQTMTIRRAWVQPDIGDGFIDDPKSFKSRRTLPIPAEIIPALRNHVEQYVTELNKGFVFRGPSGVVSKRSNFHTTWSRARERAKLPEGFHWHDLRGSGATWLAEAGATPRELMDWLGHGDEKMALAYIQRVAERPAVLASRLGIRAAEAAESLSEREREELRRYARHGGGS